MTKPLRVCPICKRCGAKKFSVVINNKGLKILRCKYCLDTLQI